MATGMDTCHHCGNPIMQGAMRCPGCGKILKTAEEQMASVDRYREPQKSSFFGSFIKLIILIAIIATAYNKRELIVAIVRDFLNR